LGHLKKTLLTGGNTMKTYKTLSIAALSTAAALATVSAQAQTLAIGSNPQG
jgi:hypothetical protein